MKSFLPLAFLAFTSLAFAVEPDYPLTEDSKPHDDVPKGELIKFTFDQSKIFPGTTREVAVYVPRQYDGTKPACVYVNQDGVQWNAPVVFDNLIAKKEIPVQIGVFIKPGVVKALDGGKALDRFNRSLEYDGLGPNYARFVLDELLPAVEQQVTSDGRKIMLSKSGNDRAIGGSSSGAIAAFIAAWERPNDFTRVYTVVCTMVGLRGANEFPTLLRKYEPKPLRVFQVDGSNDNNIYGGDWWMANQELERSLTFMGYEHDHVWGEGGHNGKQGTAVFPDAIRFLWKGWPEPVKTGENKNAVLNDILIPGEGWQLAWQGGKLTEGPAANVQGEVFFNDIPGNKTYKIGLDGKVTEALADAHNGNGEHFGPDGRRYVIGGDQKIRAYDSAGAETVIAEGFAGNDLVVGQNGNIYASDPLSENNGQSSRVWLIKPDGTKQVVDTGIRFTNGVALSPDQSLLYVTDFRSHWIYSFQVQPDGTLAQKQRYYWLHQPDNADDAGADGIRCDNAGRLYVATRLGIQVCDQAGRVNCILPLPGGRCSNLVFGGAGFDTLYATVGGDVYKRKLKTRGDPSFLAPIKPAPPHL